ncbi:hypothetical protein SVIOM342S_06815 [Streptomyces violaceorubidus]
MINLPSIFTDEEVQELKSAMESRRPSTKTRSRIYLLTGLMTSPCGKTYEGHQHRPTEVIYRCKGRHRVVRRSGRPLHLPLPRSHQHREAGLEDVMATLGDADRMKAMAQDWLNATSHKRMDYTKRIAELDQRIAETEDLIDITAATAAKRALRRGLSREEAEEAAERAAKPHEDELAGLEKLRREAEAWQREAAETGRWLQNLERLAEVAGRNLQDVEPAEKAELLRMMKTRAEVLRCAPRRKGVCLRGTGVVRGRRPLRPVLTDDAWERIAPLMGGPRCTIDRRVMVEALLEKATSGARYKELAPKYGVDWKTLQTQANRWLNRGVWAEAMKVLADAECVPVWQPDPVEIKVTFAPLALESRVGVEERDGSNRGRRHRTPCARRSPGRPCPG